MARPARNNADYFTHPANFRNDRRVKAIRARLGLSGYGLLLMIMEVLTDADHTQLSTDEVELELLAGDFGVSVTEIDSLLQICEKIGLLSRNRDGNLICEDLNNSLKLVFDKRNRSREADKLKQRTVSVTETPISVTETPQSKVKESKVKDTNVSKGKPPSVDESKQAYRENVRLKADEHEALVNKYGEAFVERCLDKLSSYKLANGKEYKSDYGAINSWVVEEVAKMQAPGGRSPTSVQPLAARPTSLEDIR